MEAAAGPAPRFPQAPMTSPGSLETDVLIVGGGPCGLMLATELGRRGVRCLVVDRKPGTAFK